MIIPYRDIDTVFLDVVNTLISIDFDWMTDELCARGCPCGPSALCRAETVARPGYSRRLFVEGLAPGTDVLGEHRLAIVGSLDAGATLSREALEALAGELCPVLRPDGRASVLWRMVMPRVPQALERLRTMGVYLVVVSNSHGTVEESLVRAGLRASLTAVVHSALVGAESLIPASSSARWTAVAPSPRARCTWATCITPMWSARARPAFTRSCSIRSTTGRRSTAPACRTSGRWPTRWKRPRPDRHRCHGRP